MRAMAADRPEHARSNSKESVSVHIRGLKALKGIFSVRLWSADSLGMDYSKEGGDRMQCFELPSHNLPY